MWRSDPPTVGRLLLHAVVVGAIVAGWRLRIRGRALAVSRPNVRGALGSHRRGLVLVAGGALLIGGWSLAVTLAQG